MSRPRKQLSPAVEAEIAARTARGESAQAITKAIRGALGLRAVAYRQRELRGKPVPKKAKGRLAPKRVVSLPSTPDDGDLVDRLTRALAQAETDGNLGAIASISGRLTALMSLKHRTSPLPQEDPNERLDFVALALSGEAKLLKLLNDLPE